MCLDIEKDCLWMILSYETGWANHLDILNSKICPLLHIYREKHVDILIVVYGRGGGQAD